MRVAWWEYAGLGICGVAFAGLRVPLYTDPGILLGWNSDAALFGLMARAPHIPLFFWGLDYLSALTSWFAAGVGRILGETGPLALRLGVAIEVFAALLFFHAALRRVTTPAAALIATFWLCAGPSFFFKQTYAPLGAEQYFFAGAVVFWYVMRTRFDRLHHWLILGLAAGLGWWIHRGVLFVVVAALVAICIYDRFDRPVDHMVAAVAFACGAALGYLPVVFGRLELDQRLYIPVTPPWSFAFVGRRIADTLTSDFWGLLGAENVVIGLLFVLLLAAAIRHFEPRRETVFAAGVVIVALGFWILSTLAYRGALRYLMIVVPIVYAFVAAEMIRLRWMGMGVVLAIVMAMAPYVPRQRDVREIVAARRERFENWGGFDPRPALRTLAARHYTACYADVWVAHKLEWLSNPRVPFIPYRSVNRQMTESLRLAGLPGPKCYVDPAGNVRTLTAREEAAFRLDTLRLVRGDH